MDGDSLICTSFIQYSYLKVLEATLSGVNVSVRLTRQVVAGHHKYLEVSMSCTVHFIGSCIPVRVQS